VNVSAMLIAASTVRMPQLKSLRTITIFRQKKLDYHESNAKIAFTTTSDATVMTVISRTRQTVQERQQKGDYDMYDPTYIFMIGFMFGGLLGVLITAFIYYIGMKGDGDDR
jgi:hypothetical protein